MAVVCACVLALLLVGLGACVLPLQFEEQLDGGVGIDDNPPAIDLVGTQPSMLGTQILETVGTPAEYELHVSDKDLDDQLYVRIFRDYHVVPAPARTQLLVGPTGAIERVKKFSTQGWCLGSSSEGTTYIFDVLVSDRPFVDESDDPQNLEPLYRALPAGTKTARSFWVVRCQ